MKGLTPKSTLTDTHFPNKTLFRSPAAGDAGERAQEDGAERTRIARGGGDRDEAGDRTRTGAEQRSLVAERALGEHPEEDAGGGRGEGVDQREAGRTIGFERRSGVEAEPDRKSTRLNSSHYCATSMPSSA